MNFFGFGGAPLDALSKYNREAKGRAAIMQLLEAKLKGADKGLYGDHEQIARQLLNGLKDSVKKTHDLVPEPLWNQHTADVAFMENHVADKNALGTPFPIQEFEERLGNMVQREERMRVAAGVRLGFSRQRPSGELQPAH